MYAQKSENSADSAAATGQYPMAVISVVVRASQNSMPTVRAKMNKPKYLHQSTGCDGFGVLVSPIHPH